MLLPTTEALPAGDTIDALSAQEAALAFVDGQHVALEAVRKAAPSIIEGSDAVAAAILAGNAVIYAAAGSSGLMALADASELPGTFGVPVKQIQIHMAGGVPVDGHMPGDTEDDISEAAEVAHLVKAGDVVIVLSASGTTPYALRLAQSAKESGARVIALANNPATPLLDLADVSICLETPPEIVAGSTRLGAGTAQKVALNLMSTLMGVKLGHVYQGMMVNVVADNAKLMARAIGMVAHIADVPTATARHALEEANGHVKIAILVANGISVFDATQLLTANGGHLAPCIQAVILNQKTNFVPGRLL